MGLARRIIPTLLCRGRQLVKGERFNAWRSVGVVAQAVRIYQQRNVDELVLLDIDATREGRGPDLKLIEELTRDCFMPLSVGGGIKTAQQAKDLLRAGADKVVVGEGGPTAIADITQALGCQAVIASVDYRMENGLSNVRYAKEGRIAVADYVDNAERAGAGEIMLTSMDREGTLEGYHTLAIAFCAASVNIPIIAHGGAGTYEHMWQAIQAGADAVAAGAMFQFTDQTPAGAARYLAEKGIEVRT